LFSLSDHAQTWEPALPTALLDQLKKPSASLDAVSLAPLLADLHDAPVRFAHFDHPHEGWQSERCFPAGIVMLQQCSDNGKALPPLEYASPASSASASAGATPRQPIFMLEYMAGTNALLKIQDTVPVPAARAGRSRKSGAGAAAAASYGSGSSSCGHEQPLIPAPQWLLRGPQHPCFSMQPTLWVPLAAASPASIQIFLTPYHHGFFHTPDAAADLARDLGRNFSPLPSMPVSAAADSSSAQDESLAGVVRIGSVVAYRDKDALSKMGQGVVLSTFVHMSADESTRMREQLTAAGVPRQHILWQLFAEPMPVPYVALRRLQRPAEDSNLGDVMCWQTLMDNVSHPSEWITLVRASDICRIFSPECLGEFGRPRTEAPPLLHRACVAARQFLSLPNPSAPSALRDAVEDSLANEQMLRLLLRLEPAASSDYTAANFIAHTHAQSSMAFPIETLLSCRALLTARQELNPPGLVLQRQMERGPWPDAGSAPAAATPTASAACAPVAPAAAKFIEPAAAAVPAPSSAPAAAVPALSSAPAAAPAPSAAPAAVVAEKPALRVEITEIDGTNSQCFYLAVQAALGLTDQIPVPLKGKTGKRLEFPQLRSRIEAALASIQSPLVLQQYGLGVQNPTSDSDWVIRPDQVGERKQAYLQRIDTQHQMWGGQIEMHLLALHAQGKILFRTFSNVEQRRDTKTVGSRAEDVDEEPKRLQTKAQRYSVIPPEDACIEREILLHHCIYSPGRGDGSGQRANHYELLRLYQGTEQVPMVRSPRPLDLRRIQDAVYSALEERQAADESKRNETIGRKWLCAAFQHNRSCLQALLDAQDAAGTKWSVRSSLAPNYCSEFIAVWAVDRWLKVADPLVRSLLHLHARRSCTRRGTLDP
jgi:hypothetical protein